MRLPGFLVVIVRNRIVWTLGETCDRGRDTEVQSVHETIHVIVKLK